MQIKVSGLKEVEAQLVKLGSKDGTRVLRRAMLVAAEPIVQQAKANAARHSGALRESIGSRFVVGRNEGLFSSLLPDMGGRFTVLIGPIRRSRVAVALYNLVYKTRRRDIYHGHFIEFGHRLASRSGGRLLRSGRAFASAAARGDFSGTSAGSVAPRPFLRPALESKASQAVQRMADELKAGIERLLRRRAS